MSKSFTATPPRCWSCARRRTAASMQPGSGRTPRSARTTVGASVSSSRGERVDGRSDLDTRAFAHGLGERLEPLVVCVGRDQDQHGRRGRPTLGTQASRLHDDRPAGLVRGHPHDRFDGSRVRPRPCARRRRRAPRRSCGRDMGARRPRARRAGRESGRAGQRAPAQEKSNRESVPSGRPSRGRRSAPRAPATPPRQRR